MVKFLHLLVWALCISAHAQTFSYQLKGKFLTNGQNSPIAFSLEWDEVMGKVSGRYSDNFFAKDARVTGSSTARGRQFLIDLPRAPQNVRSLTLLTSATKNGRKSAALPVSITTRDGQGSPLASSRSIAVLSSALESTAIVQREEESPKCSTNFGALAGYCGKYGGLIFEDLDVTNSCNLLSEEDVTLELNEERNIYLHLAFIDPIVSTPNHRIGRLPANPANTTIDVTSRFCGRLPGTLLPASAKSCKRLNLSGSFFIERERRHFTGTYTIYDEQTKRVCRYGLSVNRE